MASKAFKELHKLSADELAAKSRELEAGMFKGRMKRVTGQLEDTSSMWRMRKDLARIKMLQGNAAKTAPKAAKASR